MSFKTTTQIFLILFCISTIKVFGQTNISVATINSKELFEYVPGKKKATEAIEELNKKYKNEFELMQNNYNNKYTDFLSNQNSLVESIKLRRMQELYEIEQDMNHFMKVAQEDITSQENQLIKPLQNKLTETIKEVGIEQSFICIYDLANPAISFVTPNAIDANPLVIAKLQKK